MQNFDKNGKVLNIDYLLKQVTENIEERDMLDVFMLVEAAAMLDESADLKFDLYAQALYTSLKQEQKPGELKQWMDNALILVRKRILKRIDQLNLDLNPDHNPLGALGAVYGSESKLYKKHNLESCRVSQIFFYFYLFNIETAGLENEDNAKSLSVGIGISSLEFAFCAGCHIECLSIAQRTKEVYQSMDENRWALLSPEESKLMEGGLFLMSFWSYKSAMEIGRYRQALEWSVLGENYVDALENPFMKSNYYYKRGEILIELGNSEEALSWLDKSPQVPGLTPGEVKDAKRLAEGAKYTIEGGYDRFLNAAFGDVMSKEDKVFLAGVFKAGTTGDFLTDDFSVDDFSRLVGLISSFLSSNSIEEYTALPGMKEEFLKLKQQLSVLFARSAMAAGKIDHVEKLMPQIEQLATGDSVYKSDAAFFLLRLRHNAGETVTWAEVAPLLDRMLETFSGELTGEMKDLAAILYGFGKEELAKSSTAIAELFRKIALADENERTPIALSREAAINTDILESLLTLSAMMAEVDEINAEFWLENVSRIKFLFSYRGQRMQKESMLFNYNTDLPADTARQIRVLAEELARDNYDCRNSPNKRNKELEVRLKTLLYPLFQQHEPSHLKQEWEYLYPELIHIETAAYMTTGKFSGAVISVGYDKGYWQATKPDADIESTDGKSYLSILKSGRPIEGKRLEIAVKLQRALLPISGVDNLPPLIGVRSTGIYHGIPLDALPLPVDEKPEQVTPATHDVTKRYSSQKKSSHENKIFTLSKTGRETQWAGEKMVSVLLTGPNSDLSIIEEPFAVKKAALFANPHFDGKEFKDLDGVRGEVDAVKEAVKKYPGVNLEVFFDSASNRENFLRMSGKNAPQVFHIATHGFSPRQDPSGSFLVLSAKNESGGRILQAIGYHDIMLMDLRQCDLVILSSCSTHEGQGILGEGIKGLAWAFKAAGAKAVIASRWEVRDQAAVAYWETFYKNLCKGLPIVDAFRQARRRLLKHDKWNHPHYWGVFQLIV